MEHDTSPVTGQQRHVFKKAYDTLPGLPGALPRAIKEQYDLAAKQKPSARAAIINAVIPKTAKYSDQLAVDPQTMQKFQTIFSEHKNLAAMNGTTWTDLALEWGRGDEDKGGECIQRALQRGDLVEKDGLYFRKTRRITMETGRSTKHEGRSAGDIQDYINEFYGYYMKIVSKIHQIFFKKMKDF